MTQHVAHRASDPKARITVGDIRRAMIVEEQENTDAWTLILPERCWGFFDLPKDEQDAILNGLGVPRPERVIRQQRIPT